MKTQTKIFLFSVMLMHTTIYTAETPDNTESSNLPSFLYAPLTHHIPLLQSRDNQTNDDFLEFFIQKTEKLKQNPTLKNMVTLIEIVQLTNNRLLGFEEF